MPRKQTIKPLRVHSTQMRTLAQRLQTNLGLGDDQRARIENILLRDHLEKIFSFDKFNGEEIFSAEDPELIYSVADLSELYHRAFDTGSASGWCSRVRARIQGNTGQGAATPLCPVPYLLKGSVVYVPASIERKYRQRIIGLHGTSSEGISQTMQGSVLCVGASDAATILGISRNRVRLLRREEKIQAIHVLTAIGAVFKYSFRDMLDRRQELQSYLVDHILDKNR